tara:strand:+ start:448 stop:1038 length:591 start_codon:yes stop_codon:yes gene_type:complete
MNFEDTYNLYMSNILCEDIGQESIALLPGGFKPPHKGHFAALIDVISKAGATSAIVYVGKGVRGDITAEQSERIWNIYIKHIDVPVAVEIAEVSPVKSVYEFADLNLDKRLFVAAGEEDMKRYAYFEKNKETYPLVKLVPIPPKFGRISGTETREKIQSGAHDALEFVPDVVDDGYLDDIRSILHSDHHLRSLTKS